MVRAGTGRGAVALVGRSPYERDPQVAAVQLVQIVAIVDGCAVCHGAGDGGDGYLEKDEIGAGEVVANDAGVAGPGSDLVHEWGDGVSLGVVLVGSDAPPGQELRDAAVFGLDGEGTFQVGDESFPWVFGAERVVQDRLELVQLLQPDGVDEFLLLANRR